MVQLIDVKERDHFFAAPVEPQHHVGRSKFDGSSTLCVGRKCLTGHVAKSSHSQFAGWEGKPFIFLCVLHLGEGHAHRRYAQRDKDYDKGGCVKLQARRLVSTLQKSCRHHV